MGAKQSAEMKRALELITRGLTPDQAASKCSLTADAVRKAMHRAGMPVRPKGRPLKEKP